MYCYNIFLLLALRTSSNFFTVFFISTCADYRRRHQLIVLTSHHWHHHDLSVTIITYYYHHCSKYQQLCTIYRPIYRFGGFTNMIWKPIINVYPQYIVLYLVLQFESSPSYTNPISIIVEPWQSPPLFSKQGATIAFSFFIVPVYARACFFFMLFLVRLGGGEAVLQ